MSVSTAEVDAPPLLASGVRRSFPHASGAVDVLRGLDLRVQAGEVVTVSGPSGSGKSALLAVLCGFDQPDSGSVHVLGQAVRARVPWSDCAVLPQAMGLAGELTVAENVALPLRLRDMSESEVDDRVDGLLDDLGIAELADRYPAEVSFGQQQRAALGRAVSVRPRLLLADEPTAHLDHATVPAVLEVLRSCAEDGAGVLIATHDTEVHVVADRRLHLVDGRLQAA